MNRLVFLIGGLIATVYLYYSMRMKTLPLGTHLVTTRDDSSQRADLLRPFQMSSFKEKERFQNSNSEHLCREPDHSLLPLNMYGNCS